MVEETKKEETPETPEEETPETEEEPKEETPEPEPEKKEEEAGDKAEPEKEKPEEDKKEEDESKEEESKEDEPEPEKSKRIPRLMEVYKHKIAEGKWDKEKGGLETTISDLQRQLVSATATPERRKLVENWAEKTGLEAKDVEEFLKLTELPSAVIQKELDALKVGIQKSDKDRAEVFENQEFEKDYEKNIVPILKADGISEENIPRLKKLLKVHAFTEEYAKSPLSVIYRGVEDFRQFSEKGKKSGEPGRGGIRGEEKEVNIMDMTSEQYDEYIKTQSQESRIEIRRDGRTIRD